MKFEDCRAFYHFFTTSLINPMTQEHACWILFIPDKKRNAPLRTVQLSGRSQVLGQFSLYQCKGMLGTAALHIFCNLALKLC